MIQRIQKKRNQMLHKAFLGECFIFFCLLLQLHLPVNLERAGYIKAHHLLPSYTDSVGIFAGLCMAIYSKIEPHSIVMLVLN